MIGAPSRVYTAEVSQPHLRGVLAAFASVGTSLGKRVDVIFKIVKNKQTIYFYILSAAGVMLEYLIGSILSWYHLAFFNAVVPAAALFLAFFIPESPSWLISSKKDENRCRASLRRVRDSKCDVDTEVNNLIMFSKANDSPTFNEQLRLICRPSSYKPFLILSIYFLLSQLSGLNVVTFYAVDVIKVRTIISYLIKTLTIIRDCRSQTVIIYIYC